MRLTAITLGVLVMSCTSTTPSGTTPPQENPFEQRIIVSSISRYPHPILTLPPITITATREQKEVKREKSQPRLIKTPCADISTGDVTEDVRARLDCLVKLVEQ